MPTEPIFTQKQFESAAVRNCTHFLISCVLSEQYKHPELFDPALHAAIMNDLLKLPVAHRRDSYFFNECKINCDAGLRAFSRQLLKNPTTLLDPTVALILGMSEDSTLRNLLQELLTWAARRDLLFSDECISSLIHQEFALDGEDELRSQVEEIGEDALMGVLADDEAEKGLVN